MGYPLPPLWPTPLDLCILEVGVFGVYGPMAVTPVPFPVQVPFLMEAEGGIPHPGCAPAWGIPLR